MYDEYQGVVQSYQLGAIARWKWEDNHFVEAGAQLGALVIHLDEKVGDTEAKDRSMTGFGFLLSAEHAWRLLEKVEVGPGLEVGVGYFTSVALTIRVKTFF